MLLHYFCLLFTLLVSPITSASFESYQCLNGKDCTFVQNISSFEEAEFRNIVFDGISYYAYSQNDCYGSETYWVPMTKTRDGKLSLPTNLVGLFWLPPFTRTLSTSYESYQCLDGKDCTFVQNISSFEEAEFRNIVLVGNSYFIYSHNDYCNLESKWIQAPKDFSPNLIPSDKNSDENSDKNSDKNSAESDILEVLGYPVARFSDGEWISGMRNIEKFVKQLDQEENLETIQGHP